LPSVRNPKILISDQKGGFVVAGTDSIGSHAGAWAIRLSADGRKLWEYRDSAISPKGSAEFSGAAMLSDGGVLLCGHEYTGHSQEAVMVRIGPDAKLLYKNFAHPAADPGTNWNSLSTCLPWHDGIAVLGRLSTLTPNAVSSGVAGWLIKLDANGQYQWDRRGFIYLAEEALESSNHDLFLVDGHVRGGPRIVRVNERGDLIATTTINDDGLEEGHLLYSLVPTPTLRLFAFQSSGPDRYLTLNSELRVVDDEKAPRLAPRKAYELTDGTAVLFGGTRGGGSTATISLRYRDGGVETRALEPQHQSFWIIDAIPSQKQNEFVTVRAGVGLYRESVSAPWVTTKGCTPGCVILSWVTVTPHR
jgi:hypothetical protein